MTFTALASDSIEVQLFPVTIIKNGVKKDIPADSPILNYNGQAYAPIRLIAEDTPGEVSYDDKSKSIYIDSAPESWGKSVIHSTKVEQDYEISIHSAKKVYKQGDLLQIWGEFKYTGDTPVTLDTPYPISYSITNSAGRKYNEVRTLAQIPTVFNSGDTTLLGSPHHLVTMYHIYESGITDPIQFFEQTPRPHVLTKGNYTITLKAYFFVESTNPEKRTKINFSTEIPISVE